jgi:hypothetical protein
MTRAVSVVAAWSLLAASALAQATFTAPIDSPLPPGDVAVIRAATNSTTMVAWKIVEPRGWRHERFTEQTADGKLNQVLVVPTGLVPRRIIVEVTEIDWEKRYYDQRDFVLTVGKGGVTPPGPDPPDPDPPDPPGPTPPIEDTEFDVGPQVRNLLIAAKATKSAADAVAVAFVRASEAALHATRTLPQIVTDLDAALQSAGVAPAAWHAVFAAQFAGETVDLATMVGPFQEVATYITKARGR